VTPRHPEHDRIRAGLTAFACGDALGVPWEGRSPAEIDPAALDGLPHRRSWPPGATSDDTEQLVLVAENLIASGGTGDPRAFLDALAAALPATRGAGPTTRAAVARSVRPGGVQAAGGCPNGAGMRVLPIGWITPPDAAGRRRALVAALTRTTHAAPAALAAANAVAAMGAHAVAGRAGEDLVAAAVEEVDTAGVGPAGDPVRLAAAGGWEPPAGGVGLDAMETAAAVVHLVRLHEDPARAMRHAVLLGGDTDTVAAITGGVLGGRRAGPRIPWADRVALPAALDALAAGLWELRRRSGASATP